MGSSGKWIKSLISTKKSQSCEQEKGSGKSRKWKLWRSASGGLRRSGGRMAESEGYESSCCSGAFEGSMAAAMATVVRAPHKDFELIRREWAATRIQTAFRAFLARRAFRALRAVVRLQAIFRGRRIRKQAAVTLKCMQALVRVQDRVRANNIQTALDNQALKESGKSDPIKEAENGWCNNRGTVQEVRSKIQMKQEGVVKRVRAIAYAEAQQLRRQAKTPKKMMPAGNVNKRNHGMSWLEGWMANKPWESRLMDDFQTSSADLTPVSSRKYKSESTPESLPHSSEHGSVQIRRNNISTRISARPSVTDRLSDPSSEGLCDESTSSSSLSTSGTPASNKTPMPSFMKATASIKAKQRGAPQWCSVDSSQLHQKQTSSFSGTLNRRSADSDLYSVKLCKDLYPLGKYDCFRS